MRFGVWVGLRVKIREQLGLAMAFEGKGDEDDLSRRKGFVRCGVRRIRVKHKFEGRVATGRARCCVWDFGVLELWN